MPGDFNSTLNIRSTLMDNMIEQFSKASPQDVSAAEGAAENVTMQDVEALRYFIWRQYLESHRAPDSWIHEAMDMATDL